MVTVVGYVKLRGAVWLITGSMSGYKEIVRKSVLMTTEVVKCRRLMTKPNILKCRRLLTKPSVCKFVEGY